MAHTLHTSQPFSAVTVPPRPAALQGSPLRWPVALSLLINAGIHLNLAPTHLSEAPYIGVGFIALGVTSAVLAVALVAVDSVATWTAAGLVSLFGLIGFVASRTVGLPLIGDDIGNWTEPLGYPTMVTEFLVVVHSAFVVVSRARTGVPRPSVRRVRSGG